MTKKNKKRKGLRTVLTILAMAVVAILAFRMGGGQNVIVENYDVVEVAKQDIQTVVRGSGVVESQDKLDVYAPSTIVIDEVYVENGDEISAGDAIAKIDKDAYLDAEKMITDNIEQIDSSINSMYYTKGSSAIYSSIKGTVKAVNVAVDDSIEAVMNKYDALFVLSADNNMRVELKADDVSKYEEGDKVNVKVGDKEVEAVITEINEFDSILKIVFKDDKFVAGDEAQVFNPDGEKIGSAGMKINVPIYIEGDAGIVRYVYVKVNDTVSQGTKLVSIKDNNASGDLIALTEQKEQLIKQLDELRNGLKEIGLGSDYIIYSQGDGIVDEMTLSPYMTVAEGMKILTLQSTHPLMMDISIDELDIANIKLGQKAELKFEALPGGKYVGEITKINSLGQSINGVTNYSIRVVIEESGDILIGMSGKATVLTEKKENALVIPIEAVQIIDDEYYVIMGEDANIKTVADRKIVTGLNDGAYIEVIEGLEEGDTVAVPKEKEPELMMG